MDHLAATGSPSAEKVTPASEDASPLPWEVVAGTDHHGAYIVSAAGLDVCDLYAMSNPMSAAICNGGNSRPVPFIDMDANARLIVRAVNSHNALVEALNNACIFMQNYREMHGNCGVSILIDDAKAALATATGDA